jgi:hypothetical protein
MKTLVWDRICDFIVETTDWQFCNEARVNGEGPVVATVVRKALSSYAPGSDGRIFVVRVNGEDVHTAWMLNWHDPGSMRAMERIAESRFANVARGGR